MKKILLLFALLMAGFSVEAQSPVQVEYFRADPYLFAFQQYQKVESFGVRIIGDFSGMEKATLMRYERRDGILSSEEIPNIFIPISDTVTFFAFAPEKASEEVELGILADGGRMAFSSFAPEHSSYILMETQLHMPLSIDDEIPIIGYTSGIAQKVNINGMVFDGIDYCGLRDAHTHPAEWYEKHQIDNYTYYTVRFE